MTIKTKYLIETIFDYLFTWGGTAGVIVVNYVVSNNAKYKITLTGIILIIACVFTAKNLFEKSYRKKMDNLLQQLAAANDVDVKETINSDIESLKTKHEIYNRITLVLPFLILYIVAYLGEIELRSLRSSCGFIMLSMGVGSIFAIVRQKTYDDVLLSSAIKRTEKRLKKE